MDDGPRSVPPGCRDDGILDFARAGSRCHFENLPLQIRKRAGQDWLDGADFGPRHDPIVDARQAPVAVQSVSDSKRVAQRRDVGIDETPQMTTGPIASGRLLTMLSVISPGPWLPNRITASSIGSTIVLPWISIVAGLLVPSPVKNAFEPVE